MVRKYCSELLDFFEWDYGGKVVAWWDDQEIVSQCGVKQGGPLSPFFFALALKEPLEEAAELFPDVEIVAYLDDITVVGKNSQVKDAFHFLKDKLASIGLRVNPGKTQILFPVESAAEDSIWWNGLVQEEVLCAARRPEHLIKVLGVPFGRPLSQAKDVLDTLVHRNDKLQALEKAAEKGLPSQAVMRLVANCVSRQPNFWLRCLPPAIMEGPVGKFKERLQGFLLRALESSNDMILTEELQIRLELPVKLGGLGWGLLNPHIAFLSSYVASMQGLSNAGRYLSENPFVNDQWEEISPVIPDWLKPVQQSLINLLGQEDNVETVFRSYKNTQRLQHQLTAKLNIVLGDRLSLQENTSMVHKTLQKCASGKGALAWVYAAPRKGFTFNSTEYAKALRLLLGLRQTERFHGGSKICCRSVNNPNGSRVDELLHHALSCGTEGSAALRDRRHNAICRVLQRALGEVNMRFDAEVDVQDGRMDIIAHDDPKEWLIDVCVPCPLTDGRLAKTSVYKMWAAKKAEKMKLSKYKHLRENDRQLVPFVIEATGGFGDAADRFLKHLGRLHRSKVACLGEQKNFRKFLIAKLSVCLMRENVHMMDEYLANLNFRVE
jgi:hypothetical protein